MKKLLTLLLMVSLLMMLCSCAVASEPEKSVDPYQYLSLPEGVEFGMGANSLGELLGVTIEYDEYTFDSLYGDESVVSKGFSGFTKIPLGNYCAICGVTYSFDNPREQEFEDERSLQSVTFVVRDTISHSMRTAEKHGDIQAEYETVRELFTDQYGEPIHTWQTGLGSECCYWDMPDSEQGIVLYLETSKTTSSSVGCFTLKFQSTAGLRSDWYL